MTVIDEHAGGATLLEAAEGISEVVGDERGQPVDDAVLSGAEMREYYEEVERLAEAQRVVDENSPQLMLR